MRWLFLVAYTCSGFAGLVYEVTWTRQLTLLLGHTTASASAVVGAFLLGLAVGAVVAGRYARHLTRAQALATYAGLELAVAAVATATPFALAAVEPLLVWAYGDGAPSLVFPLGRLAVAFVLVLIPAVALGATYPCAIRWLGHDRTTRGSAGAMLYATNTLGAAAGALVAGFVLLPSVGVRATTAAAVGASILSAAVAWQVRRHSAASDVAEAPVGSRSARTSSDAGTKSGGRLWLAAGVLGLSGFASLTHEIAWTRILALTIGPTTYAFAAALAAVIAGTAAGSWLGTWAAGRTRRPALWLALGLALAAATASVTYAAAGRDVPLYVAQQLASSGAALDTWIARSGWITALLVVPTALALGAAFPLALAVAGVSGDDATERVGLVYAVNTFGAVAGSLAAGFVVVPAIGLQGALQLACGCLVLAAAIATWTGDLSTSGQAVAGAGTALALATLVTTPPWNRALMAGGAYLYAPFAPAGADVEAMLSAGSLLYYRDGASATVSVRRLTGTTTLTVDGKTDASNHGDMLTQALVAHLPLMAHEAPRRVAVIGLGSGVTVGAALTHPVERVDVVEISPEVVEASRHFEAENRAALADPRTRLILGDGRTHLRLSRESYDVIVSEPSNPWIAGVAALFTREYFAEARMRLRPGGVFCQWANAYNISDRDLRGIAATFGSVFPDGIAVLVGEHDVLFLGATLAAGATPSASAPVRLEQMTSSWTRSGAVTDLARYGVGSPFALLSLVVAGPRELADYGRGSTLLDDDRMALEFSAPREIHRQSGAANGATLRALGAGGISLPAVHDAFAGATAADWRDRGRMLAQADAHARALDDFARALAAAPDDAVALEGLVRSAVLLRRAPDALAVLQALPAQSAPSAERLVARSRLHAAAGETAPARRTAQEAVDRHPSSPLGLEQLASLAADAVDAGALDLALADLAAAFPERPSVGYYRAVRAMLQNDPAAALDHAEHVIGRDAGYAPAYDLAGAALTKLDRPEEARRMFERSLAFDRHDSTAYANLGLLALAAGQLAEARSRFAEALWLDERDTTAREGLARAVALAR